MKATLENAWGYQGVAMNLPARDIAAALPFDETVLAFRVLSRRDTHTSAVLARDDVQIALAECGGDFDVTALEEFNGNGLQKELPELDIERQPSS